MKQAKKGIDIAPWRNTLNQERMPTFPGHGAKIL